MSDELTDLARRATSGKRTPVRRFLNELKEASVLVPTHPGPNPGPSIDREEVDRTESGQENRELRPRVLETDSGTPFLPLFTGRSFLEAFLERMDPETESFEGSFRSVTGSEGLGLAEQLRQRGTVEGVVFDLYQDTELRVFHEEVKQLARDKAVPLKQHLLGEEVGEGSMHIVPPPETTVPDAFTETLQEYVRDRPDLESSSWVWGLNPEVDNRPHLIVNLETGGDDVDREAHVKRLIGLLEGTIPEPGFVEVVFDKTWG